MEFYRAETLMENLQDYTEKENEQRKKQEKEQEDSAPSFNTSSMSRDASRMMTSSMPSMPSMPSMGNFKF